jgi:hypothetical protein
MHAVRGGWRAFRGHPGTSLLAMFVAVLVMLAAELIPFLNLLLIPLAIPALVAGVAGFLLRTVRAERPPVSAVFDGFRRWSSVTGAMLLFFVVQCALMTPMFITMFFAMGSSVMQRSAWEAGHAPLLSPAWIGAMIGAWAIGYPLIIWWWARVAMVAFVLMEPDRPGAMTAFQRTWDLTRGSVWRLVGLHLLALPIALLGLLALVVGVIVAGIVMYLAYAHAYEQLRARLDAQAAAAVA